MIEAYVDISTAEGRMDSFVTRPQEGGPFPAVVIFMDIWGLRDELFEIARRVATTGYVCVVPNFYYREGRIRFDSRNADNKVVSFSSLDEKVRTVMEATLSRLSNAMVTDDTGALLKFLKADPHVRPGAKGAIGYCMGGRHVLCAAATYPDHFRASVSLHGTAMVSDRPDSPHLNFGAMRGELYCGFGENDSHTDASLIASMDEHLRNCAVDYSFEVHKGANHGYALPNRDVYNSSASARDWELIHAMFKRQLPM